MPERLASEIVDRLYMYEPGLFGKGVKKPSTDVGVAYAIGTAIENDHFRIRLDMDYEPLCFLLLYVMSKISERQRSFNTTELHLLERLSPVLERINSEIEIFQS